MGRGYEKYFCPRIRLIMIFNVISSGSKGNATIIKEKDTVILIDMGITFKRLEEGLKELNLTSNDIDYVLVTHNHTDHISGLKFFSPSKCYALEGTLPSLCHVLNLYEKYDFKDFKVTPLPISHDAKNPCCFLLESDNEKLAYVTDTGYMNEETIKAFNNPTYLIIESNHDIRMLLFTNRPKELKDRIKSDYGHLCNEDSAIAASQIIGPNTKEIVLAHLSEEANTPEVALKAYEKIFAYYGIKYDVLIRCANQRHSLIGGNIDEN